MEVNLAALYPVSRTGHYLKDVKKKKIDDTEQMRLIQDGVGEML